MLPAEIGGTSEGLTAADDQLCATCLWWGAAAPALLLPPWPRLGASFRFSASPPQKQGY